MSRRNGLQWRYAGGPLFAVLALTIGASARQDEHRLRVRLTEWNVELSAPIAVTGSVAFDITNAGTMPHAFEVEGPGIERETSLIQPGAAATLTLALSPGRYEVYCPVGDGAHERLGMKAQLTVTGAGASAPAARAPSLSDMSEPTAGDTVHAVHVTGGGAVIQILPGPFPFPDSATPVFDVFGAERAQLETQMKQGPYSNNVGPSSGMFTFTAWDMGTVRDSVDGVAEFVTQNGAHWKLVLDRVQTKDTPHHPRFGGVILGLYYHGNTGVHTPLVPTVRSTVALWAVGHLYQNGVLVTDSAMVHVMLVSRTRRPGDFALACWDCSNQKIEELQLQVTAAPGQAKFDAPGGFLFINWEQSRAEKIEG